VRLWDAVGMREALVLSCDRTEMKCVSLSKDGRALAGIGVDGRVRVWR
jgi:hypothetical protein